MNRSDVVGVDRTGDRFMLRLSNGVQAPVSRAYMVAARAAGLIGT